jgi:hypothetical protein
LRRLPGKSSYFSLGVTLLFSTLLQLSCGGKKPQAANVPAPPPAQRALPTRMFAPYLATWQPNHDIGQIAQASGIQYFSLAFVISNPNACLPMWSSKKPVAEESEMSGEITALRNHGGDVIISFGGANGKELAQTCQDAASLQAAYQAVIDKYNVRMLDFDIEAAAIRDPASIDRRDVALAALESANPGLTISFTLAASPDGLLPEGLNLLKNALQHNVKVATVNILAMDYGPDADPNGMGQNAISAATHTLQQLKSVSLGSGLGVNLGITVMVGRNDVSPEVFAQNDAQAVLNFAQANPDVHLLSIWSIGRDRPCPGEAKIVSGTCSGITQQPYEFAHIFGKFE